MTFKEKYSAFFGRAPDLVLSPMANDPRSPFVYRFPPTSAGFFKRIFTPLSSDCVFMTEGMSSHEMLVPPGEQRLYPSRIELLACSSGAIVAGPDRRDVVTSILQRLAVIPFQQKIFFGPLHTFDFQENICVNSAMTGFVFAVPDGLDMRRLCSCTPSAQLVVSLVPVAANEIRYAKDKGSDQLLAQLESAGVPPVFDLFRKEVRLPAT